MFGDIVQIVNMFDTCRQPHLSHHRQHVAV